MAIIDIDTGAIKEPETIPVVGRIIDLNTGSFVNPEVAPRTVLGAASTRQQEAIQPPEETRATQELEELGAGGLLSEESIASVAKIAPVLALTTDPREIGDILTSTFPHIGITEDEQGNLIANNNQTGVQVVINKPGISGLDIIQGISTAAAFTPGAQAAAIPVAAGKRALTGAVTAAATQTGIEAGQEAVGGEFDEDEIAIATGLGGTAELVLPVIQSLRKSRLQKQAAQSGQDVGEIKKLVDVAEEASEATKIPLFQAQKTTIPSQLEKQSFVQQLPAGTAKASQSLRSQNKAVSGAVDEFLETIAPPDSVIKGPAKVRTAAENAIERAKQIRAEKASPLYKGAFKEGAEVDLTTVTESIDDILSKFPENGEVFKNISKVKKSIAGKDGQPSLELLHNAKVEIDQMINKVGEGSLGNTTKGKLVDIKNQLLAQMDEASDLYRSARNLFAAESPAVDAIQDSIIGNIAGVKDTQLKSIAGKIFDPKETNRQVMKQAKRVIQDVDPDAWDQIVRAEMENRLGAVRSTLEEGTLENVPDQMFRALFVPQKRRDILFSALNKEQTKNMRFLEVALGRAKLGRVSGSQTAGREEIKKELRGGFWNAVRNFIGKPVSSIGSLGVTTLSGTTADVAFDNNVKALTEALFDPQWKLRMKDIRKLGIDSPAAGRAMTQLLDDALATDLANATAAQEQTQ